MWTAALIVAAGWTVKDVKDTCQFYISEPTMTLMQMNSSSPVQIPHLKFCLAFEARNVFRYFPAYPGNETEVIRLLDSINHSINLTEETTLDMQTLSASVWLVHMISLCEIHDIVNEPMNITSVNITCKYSTNATKHLPGYMEESKVDTSGLHTI